MPDMGAADTYDELLTINPAIKVLLSSGYARGSSKTGGKLLDRGLQRVHPETV